MTCSDCNEPTLSDGVCIDCSRKRFDDYPRLKAENSQLKQIISNAGILMGKDAENFEKYMNRKPTQSELDFVKEADIIYQMTSDNTPPQGLRT